MSKEERYNIPIKYFNLDEKSIQTIRKISDIKKRLIEAAKLQYETFKDIHSYLTVWIAGCGSDSIIREKFGSTQNLLNIFSKPSKFPEYIQPSWIDIKKKVKIPNEMTEKLAEETGIHIGDGNLNASLTKEGYNSYRYGVSGDLTDELIYHQEHIKKLIEEIYNITPNILKREDKNNIETYCRSRAVVEFKNKFLGLPVGSKLTIKIPKLILGSKKFQINCMVGIIDTDFSITENMAISGKLNSLLVIKEMDKILSANNIPHKLGLYQDYGRFYIKKEGALKIIEEWGLKNQKHLSKYKIFKEFKTFIPFTNTSERLAVLDGKIDINALVNLSKQRSLIRKQSKF